MTSKNIKLRGVIDFSLGNFLCLRGFAPMGELHDISEPDGSFQRDLLAQHKAEMVAFLNEGEFLFFPEVVLAALLSPDDAVTPEVLALFEWAREPNGSLKLKLPELSLTCKVEKLRGAGDTRTAVPFRTGTLELPTSMSTKFSRIDGNHRLSATNENERFRRHNTPFCLMLFRNRTEGNRFSRALFHNINYKSVPLTMEQNLRLILDDTSLFPDDQLRTSFGWTYAYARKLHDKLDLDLLANIKPFIEDEPRTFIVRQLDFLREKNVLKDEVASVKRYKEALSQINSLFDSFPQLKLSRNRGLLAALVYYQFHGPASVPSFVRWVLANHLYRIEESSARDLIAIFDQVLESRRRTIFVSMPFGKSATENHYKIIERVTAELSKQYGLQPPLKVERVDWFHDGTSYEINDKIIEMMSDCGLLIGNLTYCNPNVYHEIGFVMGKAKAEGKDVAEMLLFLDESISDEKDKFVGFNLRGIKQLRFTQSEAQFAPALRSNLEKFYNLAP